jgi:pantoate--beta-alanine ligase
MKIIENPTQAYEQVNQWRRAGLSVGLVPTMGALHAGHLALVERSVQECQRTIATIFVNPTQFAPHEDFSRYPRTLEDDLRGLELASTDLVFLPQADDLYPPGFSTYVQPPQVAQPLEGHFRPEHFRGVTTVVLKLFNILPATNAYFGQKDFQQWTVIRHMVRDLNLSITVHGCPTVREADGLALSSRNRYLQPQQRSAALSLWRALSEVRRRVEQGSRSIAELEGAMREYLLEGGMDRIDYARIVDRNSLDTLEVIDRPAIALIAAHIGSTRLIDNLLLPDPSPN